ncbi:sortase [Agromyces badenianii]|uniref:sortase n=1 Tax=Agromyces badenianii TaxID=2080742 RepID=UPI000D59D869|nr:class E sortase [Agromyces badenianii]PWC04315.1 sortase [Agromyces badenianii]
MSTDVNTDARAPEADGMLAPPGRPDELQASGRGPRRNSALATNAVTEVLRRIPRSRKRAAPPAGGKPPGGNRTLGRLPSAEPRQLAPRDTRWWAGAAVLTLSLLLLGFVGHVAVFSTFQHHKAQEIGYQELRTSLAKAEAPVGQLDFDEQMVPLGTAVALLQIPAVGVSEVVAEGTTAEVLRSGAGHRRDSVMPGQAGTSVIMGRQTAYGGPFGSLNRLEPGDEITVTTGQGTHVYQVLGLRRAGDPMPEPLRPKHGRLELITADGLALFPSGALHIDAQLTSTAQSTPSKVMAYQALPIPERAMGQDATAWFIAFFSLVFFAAAGITLWWLWKTWGRWQTWLVGVPLMLVLGVTSADIVMNALPNLL